MSAHIPYPCRSELYKRSLRSAFKIMPRLLVELNERARRALDLDWERDEHGLRAGQSCIRARVVRGGVELERDRAVAPRARRRRVADPARGAEGDEKCRRPACAEDEEVDGGRGRRCRCWCR